ncbi:polysaccharide export outer membrane protein [Rhodoblastus acidophilus]|uniref:polysaccharide biosynthesis/export family protein n=1 Tax=Rhodoblastus acidophilus TaxID=1074 RepID=UPI002225615A|nr:polysaccharide biosynthesis/export family protein [Rhodoblastus acidophilus]MCW2283346.1 polysaccharide export outer membrane protein [Rhodoblastus acidophilus]MCW2332330.1 polysaccharide export outer membrane protein [Rhodoblastus acidophilus]
MGVPLISVSQKFAGMIAGLLALSCSACTIMPVSGPQAVDVTADPQSVQARILPYTLVPVTPAVVEVLGRHVPRLSGAFLARTPPKAFRFGKNDLVSVTIFEAAAGGLFTSNAGVRAGNYITVPNQAVDENGNITVPYGGEIRAAGRTPVEIQNDITARLKARALEPQVIVALAEQRTALYSVLGDVHNAGRFPAQPGGERVLDGIARAGGPVSQGYDVWVSLERNGRRASAPMGALLDTPAENIYLLPNDVVFLYSQPQTFVAFGASGQQGQFKFEAWRLSLAEALAKQGGLNDSQADPASVFLYRGEPRAVALQLGVDVAQFPGPVVPVIYQVNLRDPSGYFLAQKFPMRNKDVIYSSNAPSVEATKFLSFVRTVLATVNDPLIYATNGYGLVNVAKGGASTVITTPTPITTTTTVVVPQ